MIATLIELQRLKGLERTGWMLRGIAQGAESVAAHSYGVAVAAMLLADELQSRGVEVKMERVLRVALLHDWAEARVGDLPRTASEYFGAEARKRAERAAFDDIVGGTTEAVAARYRELHEDYEERLSLEARLVKAADVIDLLVQTLAFERAGVRGLDEFWGGVLERDFCLEGVAAEVVSDVLRELVAARREVLKAGNE
ncbi:MAG: HD family hydrolase [Pyrinomonadaceae bacterium]|nr:HD family hydrolase [Pyrinomonadaceae bacterium]